MARCFIPKAAQSLISKQTPAENQKFLKQSHQSVLECLRSSSQQEMEVKLEDQLFAFVFAPVVESDYVNIYGRDITGRKKIENTLIDTFNALSLIAEKLDVVGKLTRHDVQNKLSAVLGNIYLTKQGMPVDSENVKYLHAAESAVDQIEHIFNFSRLYKQIGVEKLWYVDVGKSFDDAVSLCPSQNGLEFVNECKRLLVFADSLLSQLLFTMIDNSLRHGEKISKIRIHQSRKGQVKDIF